MNDYEEKHNRFLRENGAECTVLLRKDGHFPLPWAGKLALYGNGARKTIKGGTGSGEVNSRFFVNVEKGLSDAGFTLTTKEWLDAYDAVYCKAQKKFYKGVKAEAKAAHAPAFTYAMGRIMNEPEYDLAINGEGDTAVYVLSRISGEGSDRKAEKGDILLTDTEVRDILSCNRKYENFMLVINAGGVVDLSKVCEVKNILVLSQLGVETGDILADILLGKSNPSGKLSTTWSAWEDYSVLGEFGDRNETRYREGIYVGYRYFDSVGKKPLFPFGFGLSYTEFEMKDYKVMLTGSEVKASVTVRNIGNYAGKEVVQVYASLPNGEINQPYQMLAGFAKTGVLRPGEAQTVEISFDMAELAGYSEKREAYILEAGEYLIRIGNSSAETEVGAVLSLAQNVVTVQARNVLGKPDFVEERIKRRESEIISENVTRLEVPTEAFTKMAVSYKQGEEEIDPVIGKISREQLIKMNIGAFNPNGGIASMVGNAGFSVAGAAGQSYMGAQELGIPSMVMADGPAGVRISPKYAVDKDGVVHTIGATLPESMVAFMPWYMKKFINLFTYHVKKTDTIKEQYATAIPIGTAIAQSFNEDFAAKCGDIVGFEMENFGVHLWLAPALNIHRDIRCGRNFEYYSEDPLLSGLITAAVTKGVQQHPGCGVTIKHYAANNQETNRTQSNSQVSERTMREIYLKGFGIAVRKSQPKAVMTSYNLLNGVHTGEHRGLIEDILRSEYGFKGIVMTDWNVGNFAGETNCVHELAFAPRTVMAGSDIFMPGGNDDYEAVEKALAHGEVTEKQLQINASRVARMAKELIGGRQDA